MLSRLFLGELYRPVPLTHRLLGMSWKSRPSSHPAFIIIFPWDPGFALDPETHFQFSISSSGKQGQHACPANLRGLFGDKNAVREVIVALQREKRYLCLKDDDRESVLWFEAVSTLSAMVIQIGSWPAWQENFPRNTSTCPFPLSNGVISPHPQN